MKAWDTSVTDPKAASSSWSRRCVATGIPVVVVAVRDPYDIAYLPGVRTYLPPTPTARSRSRRRPA